MHVDVLVIGQGLCGSFLSWNLFKEGKTFSVIDDGAGNAASKVAAGIINPVTGRRYSITWMAEELMSYAAVAYKEFGDYLGHTLLLKKNVIDFFPSPQMRNAFVDRVSENDTYLHAYPDQNSFNALLTYDFGCGEIAPAYIANVSLLLSAWQKKLKDDQYLLEEKFDVNSLQEKDGLLQYGTITADKIVFCDGISAATNPWFSLLPFSGSKGEALLIECEGIPDRHIYKKGMMLAPLAEQNLFWLGSNYLWEYENEHPSTEFYNAADNLLKGWLKLPYKIVGHKAAIRPSTLERRPFVGFHPQHNNIGILNGMGTKGTSLAPFFANQLVQHMVHQLPITPEASVHRFSRILSK